MPVFRIMVVNSNELLSRRIAAALDRIDGLEVVARAQDPETALHLSAEMQPNVLILPSSADADRVVEPLKRLVPGALVVAVADHPDNHAGDRSASDGAIALLVPDGTTPTGLKVIATGS